MFSGLHRFRFRRQKKLVASTRSEVTWYFEGSELTSMMIKHWSSTLAATTQMNQVIHTAFADRQIYLHSLCRSRIPFFSSNLALLSCLHSCSSSKNENDHKEPQSSPQIVIYILCIPQHLKVSQETHFRRPVFNQLGILEEEL